MNWKVITRYIGISLLLVASLMMLSGIVACFNPGDDSFLPLFYSAIVTGTVGIYPFIFVRKSRYVLSFREGNTILVGAWFLACLFGMLPFLFYGNEFTFVNAFFESVSGFTTTGASILNDIESLPRGIQLWRISTAWVGGVGILTLFSMITGRTAKYALSKAEISSIARETIGGMHSNSFANRMIVTYMLLTFITFLSLKLTGLTWFDAVTNAMSACSTCGFCTKNSSIAFYENPAAETVLTIAMLVAAINYILLFLAVIKGSFRYVLKSETIRVFLSLVGLAIIIVTIDLLLNGGYSSLWQALRDSSFQVASISTTTGFATADTTTWPPLSMSMLIICSLACGCSGSTSGGFKTDRAILAFKGIQRKIAVALTPNSVKIVKVDGRIRTDEQVGDALGFIFLYMMIVLFFAFVNCAFGQDFTTGLTASIACAGNVGPGFGDVGSMSNYASFPVVLKITSMIEMLIGRLEIFPILYLLHTVRRRA